MGETAPAETKECVFCAETIKSGAVVCKHCARPLPERAVKITHRENALGLGLTTESYGIWDLSRGGEPLAEFPRDDEGWQNAWARWESVNGRSRPQGSAGPPSTTVWAGATRRTNGKAVASLVLGILWIWGIGAVVALFLGYAARREIDASGGSQEGRAMATAGIVLGWIGLAGLVIAAMAASAGAIS
ncbi:MAG TPA: DUF4190 domain-containing protein [Actinomycetota bacterium]|nr:DUF4190 domain-containing protein [Actinomycetota bacterium]